MCSNWCAAARAKLPAAYSVRSPRRWACRSRITVTYRKPNGWRLRRANARWRRSTRSNARCATRRSFAAMNAHAGDGYTVATDLADALIARGVSARDAHALRRCVGARRRRCRAAAGCARPRNAGQEAGLKVVHAPLDPAASVSAKKTGGSTSPDAGARVDLAALAAKLDAHERGACVGRERIRRRRGDPSARRASVL